MDVDTHQLTGTQTLEYTNNSPDTLYRVFYHLYFNAFQPGSMMDIRSLNIEDPDSRVADRISKLQPDEIGFLKINSLLQDGIEVEHFTTGTILEAKLSKPILPGATTSFDMEFHGQVPLQIRRSGRDNAEGVSYSMTQWYPKIAEYDYMGWHPTPYVGREFHGVWGDYEVKLHIDKSYIVAATGYLQNAEEVGHGYDKSKSKSKSERESEGKGKSKSKSKSRKDKITWHFKAPMVHDFMWAADPDYQHVTAQVTNGPKLHFFYIADSATDNWEKLPEYTVKAFAYMNENYGQYPYQKYSVIQGGDGGMEYPMGTLITGHRSLKSLVGVTVHELIHSWYQGVLANNESLYPWMDEGFTSFVSEEVMDYLFEERSEPHPQINHFNAYINLARSNKEEPLSTHADHFNLNAAAVTAAYSKGAVFLRQLIYIIGENNFKAGMLRYFDQWKFKHPQPNDFKRIMEKESGIILSWYFEQWINTTKTIDYGIQSVEGQDNQTVIVLERDGDMVMPIDLQVNYTSGSSQTFNVPLRMMRNHKPLGDMKLADPWPWTYPTHQLVLDIPSDQIESVEIDPGKQMADVNRDNNYYGSHNKKKQGG